MGPLTLAAAVSISPLFYFVLLLLCVFFFTEAFKIISIQLCIMFSYKYLSIFPICDDLVEAS